MRTPKTTPIALVQLLALFALCRGTEAQLSELQNFTNLNKSIPDGSASGMHDVQNLVSSVTRLSSLRVNLQVNGEFNGDLYGYVRHIQGNTTNFCVLLNRAGKTAANPYGYPDSGLDVVFDDSAGDIHLYGNFTNPAAGTALQGVWAPDARNVDPANVVEASPRTTFLASFAGVSASGEWTLFLADLSSGGTNMLAGWGLEFMGQGTPALAWSNPADITYGTALGSSQLNATARFDSTNVSGTFTYSPPLGTILPAGSGQTLSVTFTPTDTNLFLAVTTNVTLNVAPAPLMVTANDADRLYGAANPSFTGAVAGQKNGDNITATFSTAATSASAVGAYAINATLVDPGNKLSNYLITSNGGTLTINAAALVVTVNSTNRLYGMANPAFTGSITGQQNGDNISASFSTAATVSSPVGNYAITGSLVDPGGKLGNYSVAISNGTLAIGEAASSVSLTSSANPVQPGEDVTITINAAGILTGTATPTGIVTFRIDGGLAGAVLLTNGMATLTTNLVAHGAHAVTGEYAGDGNFIGSTNALAPAQVVNTPPVPGAITLLRDSTNGTKVLISSLLANATDADHDPITFLSVSASSANGGSVRTNGGWVFYAPPAGSTNADSFVYTISDGYAQVTGVVTVSVRVDNGPSPNLTITAVENGGYRIRGDGIPGRTYRIQYADSVPSGNWQTLGSATANTVGLFEFIDAEGASVRFYRSVFP